MFLYREPNGESLPARRQYRRLVPARGTRVASKELAAGRHNRNSLSIFGYNATMLVAIKPLRWVGSAKRDLSAMPGGVQDTFGYALHLAQVGGKHSQAKPLKGFGGAGVLEVVEDHQGDTYRAVYTARYAQAVYVVHCFQKKATTGIATPKPDMELIERRLKAVDALERESRT